MPETHFQVRWPDGQTETCYSPSLVVKQYFEPGTSYTVTEFLEKSRESLRIASDRVQAKYGFPCSRALGQLSKIEATAQRYADCLEQRVTVLGFEDFALNTAP